MATTKKRMNISMSKDVENAIAKLAKRDEMPEATKAGELIRIALEIEEDQIFDSIASKRDTRNAKYIPHSKAWA